MEACRISGRASVLLQRVSVDTVSMQLVMEHASVQGYAGAFGWSTYTYVDLVLLKWIHLG